MQPTHYFPSTPTEFIESTDMDGINDHVNVIKRRTFRMEN